MFIQAVIIVVLFCVWKREIIWPWIKGHTDSALVVTLIASVIGALIVRWSIKYVTYLRFYTRPYITLEADFTQVFRLSMKVPNLEYSVGEERWKELGEENIVFGGNRGKLLLRGRSEIGTYGATISFASNAEVICSGDIRTLIDYRHYDQTDTQQAIFSYLFYRCTQLVVAPELPATKLAKYCYSAMFSGCSSLKTAPNLPAMQLADCCYSWMFSDCSSLERTPELPAMTLADQCYSWMFADCSSLILIPELPATVLAVNCYSYMFFGCTSLERVPELFAIDLADYCYSNMFSNCISMKIAPELLALKLANHCYKNMFRGCSSLCEISIMAVDIPNKDCFDGWLDNTSPKGTLYKNKNAKWDDKGIVPEGWIVELVDPDEEQF